MPSYKSPSSKRFKAQQDRRDILATRRARESAKREGTSVRDLSEPTGRGYESAGHYHWRQNHKNLSRPTLRTRKVCDV